MFRTILSICVMVVILVVSPILTDAGLELDNRYGDIVAIYRFADASDSGPRQFNGHLHKDAAIVRARQKNKALQMQNKGHFSSCCNDYHLALLGDFSIVAWIKLKKQEDSLNIGMHGITDDGASVGYANLIIKPDGNLFGWFSDEGNDRSLRNSIELQSTEQNVSDNKWHHIAFTGYGGIYTLFVDGEVVARRHIDTYVSFISDKTNIYITNTKQHGKFKGNVFVDEVAFFELGFSVYEIRAIYRNGLQRFMKAMPVDPAGKIPTTWGKIKSTAN